MLRTATQWLINASETGHDRFYVPTPLAVQQSTRAGLTPVYTAANVDGHNIPNGGAEVFHIKTVGTACTVTIAIPGTVDGQAVTNKTVVLSTNQERIVGPFPPNYYNQADGSVLITFSAVTAVTIAALRCGG
ncbi:MAG TPA: hypothetical protein VK504_32595 [Vicinamibacterales bacterium]|nr:hypothetical protein [Vicinamibacterales bacterium]